MDSAERAAVVADEGEEEKLGNQIGRPVGEGRDFADGDKPWSEKPARDGRSQEADGRAKT